MSGPPPARGGRGRGQLPFHTRGGGSFASSSASRGPSGHADQQIFSQGPDYPPVVNTQVTKVENEVETNIKKAKPAAPAFPPRLGFTTLGKGVVLWTNSFQMHCQKALVLYHYSLEALPDGHAREPVGKKLKRVVEIFLEQHLLPHGKGLATDYKSNLLSTRKIDIADRGYAVTHRIEGADEPEPNDMRYRIRLQLARTFKVSDLLDYLTSSQVSSMLDSKLEMIQALNIIVGQHAKSNPATMTARSNRHFQRNAPSQDRMKLGQGLEVIRGFVVSVRAATARILVNVQVKNTAFYEEGPLVAIMKAWSPLEGSRKVYFARFLRNLSIDRTHFRKKNKAGQRLLSLKKICGLATKDDGRGMKNPPRVLDFGAGAKHVEFFMENSAEGSTSSKKGIKAGPAPPSQGRYISVFQFFQQTHGITIKEPNLPVVNVGTREKPLYLPAEVCMVIPGQMALSKLSPAQTQQMIKFAVRKPALNATSIVTKGTEILGFDPTNATLREFGIDVTPKLLAVLGRVLNAPGLIYAKSQVTTPKFGSWNTLQFNFIQSTKLPSWTYLWISLEGTRGYWKDEPALKPTFDAFHAKLKRMGMSAAPPVKGQHIMVTLGNMEAQINNAIGQFTRNSERRPRLILVILPEHEGGTVYNYVKYACDIKEGLLNVCVYDHKFWKNDDQYFANVGLKFNLKLGGRNHALDPSKLGVLSEGKTMVVGIDVTHPSPGSSSTAPSVSGIVASVDKLLGQWPGDIRIQTPRQEMVDSLGEMFKGRLNVWRVRNKTLPENVIIYRDGVSEGQYDDVLRVELAAVRNACRETYPATEIQAGKPRISIIVVGKRHHRRFYATQAQDTTKSTNPMNGTVVDRGLAEAANWDFYLQAHAAITGTARPAHYYVIYDEIFRYRKVQPPFRCPSDVLIDLTHNMCYLYGRATKAVSICPPAYYADLTCERARCYLHRYFDPWPTASLAGSSTAGAPAAPDASLVRLHEKVKDSMFYI